MKARFSPDLKAVWKDEWMNKKVKSLQTAGLASLTASQNARNFTKNVFFLDISAFRENSECGMFIGSYF